MEDFSNIQIFGAVVASIISFGFLIFQAIKKKK